MSEYPCNEKNNTFAWLSSLYNPFNPFHTKLPVQYPIKCFWEVPGGIERDDSFEMG